ncbi:DUF748 domain-containing protein [Phenylobacterium sp.]|uniref:DUF748 domain-containing protein n=1 Tax=Phenylobacterium sp. TaxID=1871053 RepID=UPI0035B3293B
MQSSAEPPAPQPSKTPRRRGGLIVAAWVALGAALLVGLYAAAGFWLAPRIIKSQVVSQVAERYHRTASLGEVRFNPFTLKLQADGFSLPDADGAPMIGFDRLTVDLSAASIWRGGLAFNEIALDAPRVRLVRRPDGRLNVQDLIPPPSGGPMPKVMIDHLAVRRGRVAVVDQARETPFTKSFSPVGFTLNNFSTVKEGAAYVLNAVSERGEGLSWRGVLGLSPLASRGTFVLTKVKVAPLAELAGEALPFGVTGGELGLSGGYRFALNGQKLTLQVDVGDLGLSGVGLRARGADADWISLPQVKVSKVHVDVPARTVSVGAVEATDPAVSAWLEPGGEINLARYAPAPSAKAAAPAAANAPAKAEPDEPWKVALPDLRVRSAKVDFEDRSLGEPVRLTAAPLDVSVTGLALPLAAPVQVEASAGLDGGGRVAAKGTVKLDKIAADLDVEAAGVELPRFQHYLDKSVSLRLLSGRLSTKGHVAYAAKGPIRFTGAAQVDRLHTVDTILGEDFVNWRSLRLDGISVRTEPLAVKVRQVVAREPYARVVIGPNYVMNVATVLSPEGAAPPPPAAPPPAPKSKMLKLGPFTKTKREPAPPRPERAPRQALPVEVALVKVENGKMDFSDLSLEPHFAAGIQALDGTIKGLSGRQDARADVDLTGQVDRYSPVKIDGQVNYFAARSFTDVKMSFQNMELTTFSPYSGKFAGYRINKGKLNVDLHYNIDDQKLDAKHHVVIDQLELGDRVDSADAVKLPVKLVIALLKDRHGVIDVPIEVVGTLDDPKFRLWPVIWQVVRNLMVKIATSPFALLGSLGGGEDLQYIDFAPGGAVLDETGRQKTAALVKALAERPALNLEAPMAVSPAVDRPALAEARFQAALSAAATAKLGKRADKAGAVEAALAEPKTRKAILEDLYRKQFGAKPEIPKPEPAPDGAKVDATQAAVAWLEDKLRGGIGVSDEDLQALGRERARAVQSALLADGQLAASRVFVTAQPFLDSRTAPVRMTLSLN